MSIMRMMLEHVITHRAKYEPRVWKKIARKGDGDCWEWVGARNRQGYGMLYFTFRGKLRGLTASRIVSAFYDGIPQEGMHICHKCDNPVCCNPKHLYIGTPHDNMMDAVRAGRHRAPEYDSENISGRMQTENAGIL